MDAISSVNESDNEPISTNILEYIRDGSQSHIIINKREARYKTCDRIKQRLSEWKGALLSTRNMGKFLHKLLKVVDNELS